LVNTLFYPNILILNGGNFYDAQLLELMEMGIGDGVGAKN